MTDKLALGPWKGINNVDDETAATFQPGRKDDPAQHLRDAVNLDLDRTGLLRKRSGTTEILPLTDGHSLTSINGRLLLVDDGALKQIFPGAPGTGTATTLATGLSDRRMSFAVLGHETYGCNGVDRLRINPEGQATFWGLESPSTPTLTATTGNLTPGTYAVAVTVESADGIESGAHLPAIIELTATGGIAVSGLFADPNAASLNLYLSETNGSIPYFKARIPLPMDVVNILSGAESRDPLATFGLSPPPSGANHLMAWRGRAFVAAGNALYWSEPAAYHLWNQRTSLLLMADTIERLVPSDNGFYLFEGVNTWWVAGSDPDEDITPTLVDTRPFSGGPALRLPGHLLPSLQATGLVSVWQSSDGPVAGLPGGVLVRLTKKHLAFDLNASASLAYRETNGIAQLLIAMQATQQTNQFAASDRPICEVRRALT